MVLDDCALHDRTHDMLVAFRFCVDALQHRYMQPEMSSESVAADFEKEAEART